VTSSLHPITGRGRMVPVQSVTPMTIHPPCSAFGSSACRNIHCRKSGKPYKWWLTMPSDNKNYRDGFQSCGGQVPRHSSDATPRKRTHTELTYDGWRALSSPNAEVSAAASDPCDILIFGGYPSYRLVPPRWRNGSVCRWWLLLLPSAPKRQAGN